MPPDMTAVMKPVKWVQVYISISLQACDSSVMIAVLLCIT